MKITVAPFTSNTEPNLAKQLQVFQLCFNADRDFLLMPPLDAPYLSLVHTTDHLERCHRLGFNGFGGPDRAKVAHAEYSVSAFTVAALAAVNGTHDGVRCAFAPVSGFHHAGYDFVGGFCTFNGLMAAAMQLRDTGHVRRVLILDGDGHYGNGTDDIIFRLHLEKHVTNLSIGRPTGRGWKGFVLRDLQDYDLVMYQAGADSHRADPYGVGHLSDGEWIDRDRFIFNACQKANVPIVWNLAGGYNGHRTLDLHTSTFETACEIFYPTEGRRDIDRAARRFPDLEPAHPEPGLDE